MLRRALWIPVVAVLAVLALPAPLRAEETPRPPSVADMRLDEVGEHQIFAEERKFLLSRTVVVKNSQGMVIWPSLLKPNSRLHIEYHFDESGQPVADTITVVGGR
jgi:hypothetical protein